MKITYYLRVAVPTPLAKTFDYLLPDDIDAKQICAGMRVKIPFSSREYVGVILEVIDHTAVPTDKLKQAIEVLDTAPILYGTILELLLWSSEYYHHSIGEVLNAALPARLRQGKPLKAVKPRTIATESTEPPHQLNAEQEVAVNQITDYLNEFKVFLLEGVTGSGKTEVYLHVIAKVLAAGKQALVLVPEIGLTPQTLSRFENRFNAVVVSFHSGLTDKQRYDAWELVRQGIAKIIIGTRSAIFMPLLNPGIIIVDEAHDMSFKQQDGFRYSARDLAIKRASLEKIPVIMGTATPPLEILYNARQERYVHLQLTTRTGSAVLPKVSVIDIRRASLREGLSKALLDKIDYHLNNKGQILIFLNRRGYAPVLICHQCGWLASCRSCDAKLTLHLERKLLYCHHCGATQKIISHCPSCHGASLTPLGIGTERIESALKNLFPNVCVARIDSDSTAKKGALQKILDDIQKGDHQILVGTQMLAKGHHFPNLTLVAILDIDGGLFGSDFRAAERMAQLLVQVAGRAGRAEKTGEVILQTRHPDHPFLNCLLNKGYIESSNMIYEERKIASLPPFSHLALLKAESRKQELPNKMLEEIRHIMMKKNMAGVTILGPIPSPMEKRAGWYRAQLLLRAVQRKDLHAFLSKMQKALEEHKLTHRVRWGLDVDPQEMF